MIGDACRDPSVLVRKQAMTSLTELLKQIPLNKDVHKYMYLIKKNINSVFAADCIRACVSVTCVNVVL